MPPAGWIVLFGLWALLSGHYDAFHLGVGLIVILLIGWLHGRLPGLPEENVPSVRAWRMPFYYLWLLWQIIVSAIYVARVVLNPGKHLDPRLIAFRSQQPSMLSHVIFANSITLTPGTLTIALEDDRYLVHALSPVTAEGTLDGSMASRVAKLSTDAPIGSPESFNPEEMIHA